MTKNAITIAFTLALALFVWSPLTAFAAESAELDTQTEELEIASDNSNANGSRSSSAGNMAKTGDESSELILASLVTGSLALLAMGVAIREIKVER